MCYAHNESTSLLSLYDEEGRHFHGVTADVSVTSFEKEQQNSSFIHSSSLIKSPPVACGKCMESYVEK